MVARDPLINYSNRFVFVAGRHLHVRLGMAEFSRNRGALNRSDFVACRLETLTRRL